jgi:acyl-coenzyme A synthetase/AMP-(fatty) acid ligase
MHTTAVIARASDRGALSSLPSTGARGDADAGDGIEEVYVAVSGNRTSSEEAVARINDAFRPYQLGKFYVVQATHIPRNENGKIQRDMLKKAVVAAVGRKV